MDLDRRGSWGQELGGVGEWKIIIRIYCIKKITFNLKMKNQIKNLRVSKRLGLEKCWKKEM